ncbi:MAG: aspartate kinase [Clostridiales bacterium]|nr:aspartate kinase [Clostridiales bacterium]
MKAVKFGGTSMSTADSILRVANIIKQDRDRRFVVVSAPGKAEGEDKVTDALVAVGEARACDRNDAFKPVRNRFERLCDGVGQHGILDGELDEIERGISSAEYCYILSRGEYLCGKLLAAILGYTFIDAAELIKFNGNTFDDELTQETCKAGLKGKTGVVVPGFYGSDENGRIVTFSRGGSDVSGAIVARAVNADVYENFTDVDGFMTCDPRFVPHASVIDVLTYKELRELAYMGANVLHPESIFPVRKANIPIHILNTFNENAIGTKIVPTEEFLAGKHVRKNNMPITAIAGRSHFFSMHIDKSLMNSEIGIMRRVLSCFERYGVSVEHIPSGIDSVTVIFSAVDAKTTNALVEEVKREVNPDHISLTTDISLIAIVGHGMKSRPGTAARAINRLSHANINLRMLDMGASEMNIILGVSDSDFERALKALTGEFEV